ncbi:methyltransferase [Vibrio sp. WXL103]|uniref:methyltransferase n=1 Tax=Vibrio sp. WXL103 TaxID=3450710 RepID=UPI003EC5759B
MKTELTLHEQTLTLNRYPIRSNETLQAWDAGDEYLINHIEETEAVTDKKVLILNDNFGALSCYLSDKCQVITQTDSHIATKAIEANLAQNQCTSIQMLTSVDSLPQDVDLVLMQLPKSNRMLTWQLHQIQRYLPQGTPVIAVNKAKEIHTSTLKLFERYLGETTTSLAWKKHRLVFSSVDKSIQQQVANSCDWQVEEYGITLRNLANVYSGESLDLGARLILKHLPDNLGQARVIDLGCGNGVLSVRLAQLNPDISLTCVDESFMAVKSAQDNLAENGLTQPAQGVANNCLDGFEAGSADFIVCNPPFHQQQAVTDHIAWQMFCDAKHVLSKGGKLLVIGNRHLGYHNKLSRLFTKAQVKTIGSDSKFVILEATK